MANTVIVAETFSKEVQKRLNDDDSFLNLMTNANSFIQPNGKTCHIPNAATAQVITIDGAINNAGESVVDFTHTDVEFTLSIARVAPIRIVDIESATNNYDAFMAQTRTNIDALSERVSDHIIYKLVADTDKTNQKVVTSGANGVGNGPTGAVRKILTLADVRAAGKIMNKNKVPKSGRVLLVNPEMASELKSDTTVAAMLSNTESGAQLLISGALGKLDGFIVVERAWTGLLSGDTAQLITATEVSTMNYTALAFHKNSAFYANSPAKVFITEGDPNNYGDIMSASIGVGAIIPRTDKKGFVIISQTA